MLENCKSAQERWGGVSEIIDRWLKERQDVLVQFLKLTEISEDVEDLNRGPLLQSLCQIIVDYISAGHFEVYDQLVKEAEEFDDIDAIRSSSAAFETVDKSTEYILDFNDKYQETDDLDAMVEDLSALGEALESRFEAEDQMIEIMHNAHKDQVTQ